jgi:hypothetical protein
MSENQGINPLEYALKALQQRASTGRRSLPRGLREIRHEDGWSTVKGPCGVTGKEYSVRVKTADLQAFEAMVYAQDAFPYLNRDDREFLISGTSPEGFKLIFPDPEPKPPSDQPYLPWTVGAVLASKKRG